MVDSATTTHACTRTARIRDLNDQLRTLRVGGRISITSGVYNLGTKVFLQVLRELKAFTAFSFSNDPYGEHDFGAIEIAGTTVFWKIDYYDIDLIAGSPDPADEAVTARVLTIMLASEY